MGLADMFSAEDRMEIKYSDFYELIKQAVTGEIALNGIKSMVPHAYMEMMMTGNNATLEAYLETGVTPDQIKEIDRLYAEKCKELAVFTKLNISPEEFVEICKHSHSLADEVKQQAGAIESLMREVEGYRKTNLSPDMVERIKDDYKKEHNELAGWKCLGMPIEEVRELRFSLDHARTQIEKQRAEIRQLKSDMERLMQEKEVQG